MSPERQPKVVAAVYEFLCTHHTPGDPLLVAVSGGPDSRALFCGLHTLRAQHRALLHVVHIDHRWRQESRQQAAELGRWIDSFEGAIFHLHEVDRVDQTEEGARLQRHTAFQQLGETLGFLPVLLAHHADDQAETVFKRICDGASLANLGGMQPIQKIQNLHIWRPLLSLKKRELLSWLHHLGEPSFDDITNGPSYCLRGKLRHTVFPLLRRELGGRPRLDSIGAQARELKEYLDERCAPLLHQQVTGPWGVWLDATVAAAWHPFLQGELIRQFCAQRAVILSRAGIDSARQLLGAHGVGSVSRGGKNLYIDRGRLFLPRANLVCHQVKPETSAMGWRALWTGTAVCRIKNQSYDLVLPKKGMLYPGARSLGRWYTLHRVPRFIRDLVPVVVQQGRVVGEFLTGMEGSKNIGATDMISVGVGAAAELSEPRDNSLSIMGL